MTAQHYVACLDLTGRRCLIVGRSESKVRALEAAGAEVISVDRYEPELLADVWLVVVVDVEQGERVFADASARRIFCNVEDVPELCTFILPALHRRGDITVAVSTAGASPALALFTCLLADLLPLWIGATRSAAERFDCCRLTCGNPPRRLLLAPRERR